MKLFLSLLLITCFTAIQAQVYQPEKVSPKVVKLYEKALDMLKDGELRDAVALLTECIKDDSNFVDAYLSLAGAFGEAKRYQQSVNLYEKARSKDATYFLLYNLPYSINLAGLGKFDAALKAVNDFLRYPKLNERSIKSAEYRIKCYSFALDYAAKHPSTNYIFTPVNLGDSVNTAAAEYLPSVTVTDSLLVYTRNTRGREDFIQSAITKNGFGTSKAIDGDINIEPRKGGICVSQDGEWMLFAGQMLDQQYRSFDIYISYNTPKGWSEPQNMGPNINTPDFWESSPSLSPDKTALYFSSTRPGGFGGIDLYVSYRQANGKWGPAQNMGPSINTAGDEQAPFIHADNQTLYFTSNGLPGYGSSDLFVIRKNNAGEWGTPENLGYPINTIENEGALAVSADGLTAYYASDRSDSRGDLDLYKFDMRPDIRPYRTLYVKGKVLDKKTGKSLPSYVELTDNSNNKALMKVQTDEVGDYFITLPTGNDYTFTVNRKGYLFYSELMDLNKKEADSTYKKDIYLQPVELNASITFRNIQFANNAYQLPKAGVIELEKLVQVLTENPSLKVEIGGHTDNVGKPEDNIVLSTNRAKAIVDYLLSRKIDAGRLTYHGYGSSKPIADNATEQGRALNRRTAFTIVGL